MKRVFRMLSLSFLLMFTMIMITNVKATATDVFSTTDVDLYGYTIILHTNDSHGRAIPDDYNGNLGFTSVSMAKKLYEDAGAKVILMDAGDTLHGLPFATIEKGETIVDLMNLVGYDVMTPGNHDFNYGTDRLMELSKIMKFPLISSNIMVKDTRAQLLQTHTIIEKNGIKYGIFGLSTPETTYKTNPNNVSTIEFTNPVNAAKEQVKELKAEGADVIIALSHLGIDKSSEYTSELVANQVDGIDLIVDGHSHSTLETGLQVKDTLIVSSGEYIKNIGVVEIAPDGTMKAGLLNSEDITTTDEYVDSFITDILKEQYQILSEEIGYTTVTLDGEREQVRTRETNLGDLTTDALVYATGADIAVTNGGGIRASIPIGEITKNDLVTVFPFGNYVVTKNVTGQAILDALELGASAYPEPLGGFLQVSGVNYTIDPSAPSGSRVQDVYVNGEELDLDNTYLLATNDFIVAGGDGYTMFTGFDIVNEYGSMEEIVMDYIKHIGDVAIRTEDRIHVIEETTTCYTTDEDTNNTDDNTSEDNNNEKDYDTYVVVKGDYLIKIADKLLDNKSEWKKIYEWNKDSISDPDLIYIDQVLKIYDR